eukprot:GHVU01007724.1.p1 GENE.GHVU01007724.1~~GHVU01007724.1.p1  ORF type:complete len:128 (-),score=12.55 GHVU01007724.1:242-625(-)
MAADVPNLNEFHGRGPSYGSSAGVSKQLSKAVSRGETITEKKSTWPFDYYQISNAYPIDYRYWWTPYTMDTGPTQFTMMHAVAYTDDGSEFGADQVLERRFVREAHRLALRDYMRKLQDTAPPQSHK